MVTKISHAPASVNLSIAIAICFLCTITEIATQPLSSSEVTVGARLPGVICFAISSFERSMLYWQRTYFWAAVSYKYTHEKGWEGWLRWAY